ncbi:MAG: hypothetical protein ABJN14_13415 [Paracoccaceae bacterium]
MMKIISPRAFPSAKQPKVEKGVFRSIWLRFAARFWKFTEKSGQSDTSSYKGLL